VVTIPPGMNHRLGCLGVPKEMDIYSTELPPPRLLYVLFIMIRNVRPR